MKIRKGSYSQSRSLSSVKAKENSQPKSQNRVHGLWQRLKTYKNKLPLSFQRSPLARVLDSSSTSELESSNPKSKSRTKRKNKRQQLLRKESAIFKLQSLNKAIQFDGFTITPPKQGQNEIMTNYLQIFLPLGDQVIACSSCGNKKIQKSVKAQIRRKIVQNSRKLAIQAYQKDIIELLVQTQTSQSPSSYANRNRNREKRHLQTSEYKYVYYKVHRDVIIWAIACSTYSYGNAEEIVEKTIVAYDEEVMDIFGQYRLPKMLTSSSERKLKNLNNKIRQILQQENKKGLILPMMARKKSKKAEEVCRGSEINMRQVAEDCLILHSGETKLRSSLDKLDEIEAKTEKMREDSGKIKRVLSFKKLSLFIFLVLNLLMILYFVDEFS